MFTRDDGTSACRECDCVKEEKLKNQWKTAGINLENRYQTFKNFRVWNDASRMAKDVAIAYFNDFDKVRSERHNSILLCGQVGSGKTHLAIALAMNFINRKVRVVYMPYRDVVTSLKQCILDDEVYKRSLSKFQTCEVLLIDDLYKGKISKSDVNIMFEIVNYRYLNHLPIIVSSEFNIEMILSFDEAIGSRIYEMCKGYIVEVPKDKENNFRLK